MLIANAVIPILSNHCALAVYFGSTPRFVVLGILYGAFIKQLASKPEREMALTFALKNVNLIRGNDVMQLGER